MSEGRPVSLSKLTLTKAAPSVSLAKHGASLAGSMRVNLNWTTRPPQGFLGRLSGRSSAVDLDLGCLYELADGTKGVVQALGNAFSAGGGLIALDGDDRSGSQQDGENLRIDLSRLGQLRRVLVFALIYEGATDWASAAGVVTLFPPGATPVEVHLDEPDPQARICGIALLENEGGDLVVRREVRYVRGAQRQLDEAYDWGLRWAPGRKS